jgi:hypothetical protein
MAKGRKQDQTLLELVTSFQASDAESLVKAQPRLIVLLGLVPVAAATAYWYFTGSPQGLAAAGLLLAAGTVFLLVQAGLRKMTAAHWCLLLGVGFAAVQINAGQIGAKALLSFSALLAMVVVAMRLDVLLPDSLDGKIRQRAASRIRIAAAAMSFLAWLATAGAPGMATMHGRAEAGLADGGQLLWHALWQLLAGKIG